MISKLVIKNYAIIKQVEINFSDHLTIITGETGAGKSILLGALGLIMGKRADTKALYNEAEKCVIEGYFNVGKYNLKRFFEKNDIDYDDEVIVRRELTPSGKSRAFINDTPVNLKLLRQLSNALIDLHQQFDTMDMHNVSFQLRMIDALAGNQSMLGTYQLGYRQFNKNQKQLADFIAQNEQAAQEMDFTKFQLQELLDANLIENEQEDLELEIKTLQNAENIKRVLSGVYRHLEDSEQSIISQIQDLAVALEGIKEFHKDLDTNTTKLEGTVFELQELASDFERIGEETEYNETRIEEIQSRLDEIYRLQQKHQVVDVNALIDIQNELQSKLGGFDDLSNQIESLKNQIKEQRGILLEQAKTLSKRRKGQVAGFEKKVQKLLVQLSMEHAQLKVDIQTNHDLMPTGIDDVNFLFAPNKGSRFELIKDVASGGELSRLALITKSLVASAIPLPTIIFDEIDTGISGDVALKMGQILQKLSSEHQVVSITHSPQIAVKAHSHYFVYKRVKDDKTVTSVKLLNKDERITEVAMMLSGNPPSNAAIENAKALLSNA